MSKLLSIILTLVLSLSAVTGCAPETENPDVPNNESISSETEESTEEEKTMFKYLNNTYYKLTHDKSLNIVFTGGSVTDGYGSSDQGTKSWAYLTTEWFKEKFPDAEVKGIKKSIGGTGTYLASFRFDTEMASQKPDLFFIEHTINDRYNGVSYEEIVRYSESLVRKAYAANPNIDIIYVFSFDNGTANTDYDQLRAHRDVAEKYGLLSIKVSDSLYEMLEETGDDYFKYYTDGVHPNDAGYAFYADVITSAIGEDILLEEPVETELKAKVLPESPLSEMPLMLDARLVASDKIDLKGATGWVHQKANFSWKGMAYNGRIFANEPGSKFTFTFEGTDFGLLYGIGPSMGKISCTIDDGEPYILDAYRGHTNPTEARIAVNLEKGEHTVVIELLEEKHESSGGHDFEIGALLLN